MLMLSQGNTADKSSRKRQNKPAAKHQELPEGVRAAAQAGNSPLLSAVFICNKMWKHHWHLPMRQAPQLLWTSGWLCHVPVATLCWKVQGRLQIMWSLPLHAASNIYPDCIDWTDRGYCSLTFLRNLLRPLTQPNNSVNPAHIHINTY